MIKTAQVVIGKTPSVVSGRVSDRLVEGEPVCGQEQVKDPGLVKLARSLAPVTPGKARR